MLMTFDWKTGTEFLIELGYGIIYSILAILTIRKYSSTKSRLALFFFIAFTCLALSGLYGGLTGVLGVAGFSGINKIMEIYQGLTLLSLVFFLGGLLSLKIKQ
jgi:hypothetical protein